MAWQLTSNWNLKKKKHRILHKLTVRIPNLLFKFWELRKISCFLEGKGWYPKDVIFSRRKRRGWKGAGKVFWTVKTEYSKAHKEKYFSGPMEWTNIWPHGQTPLLLFIGHLIPKVFRNTLCWKIQSWVLVPRVTEEARRHSRDQSRALQDWSLKKEMMRNPLLVTPWNYL